MFNWIMGIALASSIAIIGGYVYNYDRRGKEIVELNHTIGTLRNEIKVHQDNKKLLQDTNETLNTRLTERLGQLKENCEALVEIERDAAANEKPENKDKPIDVFGNLLERLKRKPTK